MLEIRTQRDIDALARTGGLPSSFLAYLQAKFTELEACLGDGDGADGEFSLDGLGHLIALQPGDDLRDMRRAGLNHQDDGLFGVLPEAIDEIVFPDFIVYEFAVLVNNEVMHFIYAQKGHFEERFPEFGPYVQRWHSRVIFFDPEEGVCR